MATKSQVEALARKKYGKSAYVRHNPKAPDAGERAIRTARRVHLSNQINALKAEIEAIEKLPNVWTALMKAARFCVDVQGGEPSMSELKAAVEKAERLSDLKEERRTLEKERDKLSTWSRRYEVCVNVAVGGIGFCECNESADTLDELAAKLSPKHESTLAPCGQTSSV